MLAGIGNGRFLVTVRLLTQKLIPGRLYVRALGCSTRSTRRASASRSSRAARCPRTSAAGPRCALAGALAPAVLAAATRALRQTGPITFANAIVALDLKGAGHGPKW
jgi:hypothetical protein